MAGSEIFPNEIGQQEIFLKFAPFKTISDIVFLSDFALWLK